MTFQLQAATLDPERLKKPVEEILTDFLTCKSQQITQDGFPDLAAPIRGLLDTGSKRLRPILALIGWHAASAPGPYRAVHHLAASLELFHAFALIHDDVMDQSDIRRGGPTIHRSFAHQRSRSNQTTPASDRFGDGAAILIGNLASAWSDELLHAGHPSRAQLCRIRPLLDEMRTEIALGQFLDLTAAGTPTTDLDTALTVIRYKTAKYTFERPLHLGAALAGADRQLLDALSAYALPLGEAFQLHDDLLGIFGSCAVTGKPALDDLRAGKATVLMAFALTRATRHQSAQLHRLLGCPTLNEEQAATARDVIIATGADHAVHQMISLRYEQALRAVKSAALEPHVADALHQIAHAAVSTPVNLARHD
ncbi:polyprenyl synthetase family protein [Streptomyces sp. NPDC001828]|uniref:polyprenyl synthetase family protein n=1 Tax=Streptomyces sp. NPDC001828 TaxID=3364615 RepID=UPI0036A4E749